MGFAESAGPGFVGPAVHRSTCSLVRPAAIATPRTSDRQRPTRHKFSKDVVPVDALNAPHRSRGPFAAIKTGHSGFSVLAGAIPGAALACRSHRRRRLLGCQATASEIASVSSAKSAVSLCGSVFLWQTPLTLPPPVPAGVAEFLPKHSVVLVECSEGGVMAFDFEPEEKDSPGTALRLLTGGSTPGRFGVKKLRRLPRGALRLGPVRSGVTVDEVVNVVNVAFDSNLSLSDNDCNNYSRAVLSSLLLQPQCVTGSRLYSTLDPEALDQRDEVIYKEPSLASSVILVAGTTVGAGILALPAVTQPVGFVPSSSGLVLAWVYMASTGLLIAEVAVADMASSGKVATSLQSMAARTIGPVGATLSSLSFVIVHFGLLVAYLSRGGELLAAALPGAVAVGTPAPVVFAAVFGGLIFLTKGTDVLEAANNVFALIVLASFAALVGLALPSAEPSRLFEVAQWGRTSEIVPTLLLSLVYHNVVPTVCAQLEGDRQKITIAIVLGSFLPLLMFLVWNGVILAAVAPGMASGTDPLDALRATGGVALANGVLAFSLSAIITSFIGFVLALTDFFADALRPTDEALSQDSLLTKVRDFGLTLGPPLAVACYDPSLFFQAIDKAGAFGVSMLFGFLPAWMALARRSSESPVLVRQPGFLGGYVRGPLVPGGIAILLLVGGGALAVVLQNAIELLAG